MDPQYDDDDKYIGDKLMSDIIYERYIISKKCATSYLDTGVISPKERKILIKYIFDELQKEKEATEALQKKFN